MLSLYFNNTPMPAWLKVTNISESLMPNFESTRFKTSFKKRVISVDISFKRNKNLDRQKKAEFLNFIKGDNFNLSKLSLPNHNDRYYLAKVTNISDIDGTIRKGSGTITFTCFDYREYDESKTILISNNGKITLKYNGSEEIYPTIKINIINNCSKIKINFNNGLSTSFLEFNDDFRSGDILILEQSTNKLTVNNINKSEIWHLNSKRHKLIPGTTNSYSLASGNATFSIEFNTAYL